MRYRPAAVSAIAAVLAAVFSAGCEHSDSGDGLSWNEQQQPAAATQQTAAQPAKTSSGASSQTAQKTSTAQSQPSSSAQPQAKTAAAPAQGSGTAAAQAPASQESPAQPAEGSTAAAADSSGAAAAEAPAAGDQVPFGSLKWRYGGVNGAGAKSSGVAIAGASFRQGGMSFSYVRDLSAWGYSSGALGGYACLFVQNNSGAWVGGKFDWISSSRRSRDFNNVYGGYAGWSLADVPNPCNAAFVIVSPDCKKRSNVIVGSWSR